MGMKTKLAKALYFFKTGYLPTGERVLPDFPDENFQNHLKVYKFLLQFVRGADVLDVGCGTGYGTAYLAADAKSVVGVDFSKAALRWAKKHYPGINYLEMDVQDLKFPDSSFDVIVSTENFEHLPNQAIHLAELARVLRPNGLCFIASPNPEATIGQRSKYHTKENSYDELSDLLSKNFDEILIVDNSLAPPTPAGLAMRDNRWLLGSKGGQLPAGTDTTWLHNTHSFFCFVRRPRKA